MFASWIDRHGNARSTAVGAVAVTSWAVATWVAPPFRLGAVGSDSTSTVVYFQRIISQERLEQFLGTAPKPLLSMIYGPLYSITGDWRAVSIAAILAYGLAVAATCWLVGRIAGWAGGAAVAIGLLSSTALLQDVALAYTVGWALLGWSVAGLAATAATPRHGVAGVALLFAGLARPETWFITFLAVGVVVAQWAIGRLRRDPRPVSGWGITIGLGSLPLLAIHDWLLTGDLVYSYRTPRLGSDIRPVQAPDYARTIVINHLERFWLIGLLGLIGIGWLWSRRQWAILVGLGGLGPGAALFLLRQGGQGIYVLDRYAVPMDVAMIVAGAIGAGALATTVISSLTEESPRAIAVSAVVAATATAVMSPDHGPLDDPIRRWIATDREIVEDFQSAAPVLRELLNQDPDSRRFPADRDATDIAIPDAPALLVPARVVPMAAAQFELPVTEVVRLEWTDVEPRGDQLRAGQTVLVIGLSDADLADPPHDLVQVVERDRRLWVLSRR